MATKAEKRIAALPFDLKSRLLMLHDEEILAVHDLMHAEMEKRHGTPSRKAQPK